MGRPPVTVGAFQLAVAVIGAPATPAVAARIAGAPGVLGVVTALESAEKAPLIAPLTARTRNLTVWLLPSPVTVAVLSVGPTVAVPTTMFGMPSTVARA